MNGEIFTRKFIVLVNLKLFNIFKIIYISIDRKKTLEIVKVASSKKI
jgi:hypothetical protein